MSLQIFVIADTHFGHKKIIEFESGLRPFKTIEEHDESLIHLWNSVVRPKDTVIHLGDVLFGVNSFSVLPRLNGIKKLVLGNHDRYPIQRYLEHFTKVSGAMEFKDHILTHIPVHPNQSSRYVANIHGHTHSKIIVKYGVPDDFYICVSAEQTGLAPVPIENILRRTDHANS